MIRSTDGEKAVMRDNKEIINRRRRKSGFTLLELLTVVVIIGFLVTLTGTAAIAMRRKAQLKRREVQKKALSSAAQTYFHEYGSWPVTNLDESETNKQAVVHSELYEHLMSSMDPTNPGQNDFNKRDIHFIRTTDFEIVNKKFLDSFNKTPLQIWIKLGNNTFWCENGTNAP